MLSAVLCGQSLCLWSLAHSRQVGLIARQLFSECPNRQQLRHCGMWNRSLTGQARAPILRTLALVIIFCLTVGETLQTALPKSLWVYVKRTSNSPRSASSCSQGLDLRISLVTSSSLMWLGMCDTVIFGERRGRPLASNPRFDSMVSAILVTLSSELNWSLILPLWISVHLVMVASTFSSWRS